MKDIKYIQLLFLLLIGVSAQGQVNNTIDFVEEIKKYDVSDLWTLEKIQIYGDNATLDRSEPLGFIGGNFQRFHIHLESFCKYITQHNNENAQQWLEDNEAKLIAFEKWLANN